MKSDHPWGAMFQEFLNRSTYETRGDLVKALEKLGEIVDDATLARFRNDKTRIPKDPARHLALIRALVNGKGIKTSDEANNWLELGGMGCLTKKDRCLIFPNEVRLPTIISYSDGGRCQLLIPGAPDLTVEADDVIQAQSQLVECVHKRLSVGHPLTIGNKVIAQDPSLINIIVDIIVEAPKEALSVFYPPDSFTIISHRFQSLVKNYLLQLALKEPGRGPGHVHRVVEYLGRLVQERQGLGETLTNSEWEVLIAATWLREFKLAGQLQIVFELMKTPSFHLTVDKLASTDLQTLDKIPAVEMVGGQQLRLRLLGALLLLAENLDIDSRSIEGVIPLDAEYPKSVQVGCWLRLYVTGILIRSGQIGLTFAVPELDYVYYLQAWLAAPLRRVFNLIFPILSEEEWYWIPTPSTSKVNSALAPIPKLLWQVLIDEQTLRSVLRPMLSTLDGSHTLAIRPRLTPAPLTAMSQPPTSLSWDLPPIPPNDQYEVELIEKETKTCVTFENLSQPYIVNLQSVIWTPGKHYQWTVYHQQKHKSLAKGVFHLLSPADRMRLFTVETELQPQTKASRCVLWRTLGLYEDVINDLLNEIQQGMTIVDRLAARQELADTYDQLAQEARRQQRTTIADEYGSLAAAHYQYLRASVMNQKDG